jgi:hypothetical protein
MATASFYILEKPLVTWTEAEAQPETRLWKACAEATSSRFLGLEWIAFLFFGALVLGALACCFSELFKMLMSGALDETVRAFLTR